MGPREPVTPLFYRYNPATDRWVRLPSPLPGRPVHPPPSIGGIIAGKFYVMAVRGHLQQRSQPVVVRCTVRRLDRHEQVDAAERTGLDALWGGLGGAGRAIVRHGGSAGECHRGRLGDRRRDGRVYTATDTWGQRARLPSPREGIAATKVLLNVNGTARNGIEVVGGISPGKTMQYVP